MSTTITRCPSCGAEALQPVRFSKTLGEGRASIQVGDLEGYRCAACGATHEVSSQVLRNNARLAPAKLVAKRLNTGLVSRRR